ncbi:hypothetical protein SAMN04488020_10125 [Palleronia marisminoris]|uniref:Uncharacterized protein n=1 Tax=Palleronia marisminoris TaxID=315423 RepID=A0A1Y5R6L3_9RHOB|nr:hypothetical protein [Palleronia marisminoris]SFG05626.1 hypothetical protein SAMN04488020_10125 [Palleronia marisminoris]SLN10443.1 hypothetical protein PAM7066_00025 [Palleronia marisminoris]
MLKLLKFVVILAVIGFIALVGFAYLGDLAPQSRDTSEPVDLNAR